MSWGIVSGVVFVALSCCQVVVGVSCFTSLSEFCACWCVVFHLIVAVLCLLVLIGGWQEAPVVSGASLAREEQDLGNGGGGGVFGMFKKTKAPAAGNGSSVSRTNSRVSSVNQALFREFSFMASDALDDS